MTIGVVVALLWSSVLSAQSQSTDTAEAAQYVMNTMCALPTGMDDTEFETLWVRIFSDEGNHTLVPVNGTNYTLCNTSQNVFLEHDIDG